ncbi:hypothetical protein QBC39DRAFT_18505 [Podospora conica]|nr:hypothetical protein QBC39DRAFT_18505 [Schizothecium conicum]
MVWGRLVWTGPESSCPRANPMPRRVLMAPETDESSNELTGSNPSPRMHHLRHAGTHGTIADFWSLPSTLRLDSSPQAWTRRRNSALASMSTVLNDCPAMQPDSNPLVRGLPGYATGLKPSGERTEEDSRAHQRTHPRSPNEQHYIYARHSSKSKVHNVQIHRNQDALQIHHRPLQPCLQHMSSRTRHLEKPASRVLTHPSPRKGIAPCHPTSSIPPPPPHQQPATTNPTPACDSSRSTPTSTRQRHLPPRSSGFRQATRSKRGTMSRGLRMRLRSLTVRGAEERSRRGSSCSGGDVGQKGVRGM